MKKYLLLFSAMMVIFTLSLYSLSTNDNKAEAKIEKKSISRVLDEAWDEYDLFSYEISRTDPIIWIVMGDRKNEEQLRGYLTKNANQKELNSYSIQVEVNS